MTFPNFDALNDRLRELFQAQQFAEALALANREGPNFPNDRPLADYLRMCAAARVGDRAQLYQVADGALADGLWYGEYMWRQTPSFAPLQGDADFEALIERSRAAQQQDQVAAGPVVLTRTPTEHSADTPLLVALHGNQASAEATLPFWLPAVALGWALAVVQSSQAMYRGAYLWDDLAQARADVLRALERLPAELPHDPARVVLAGHSMGGLVSIRMALQGEARLRGFIANGAVAPFLDAPDELEALLAPARERGLRGYFIVGGADDSISADDLHTLAAKLRTAGLACQLEIVPGAQHDHVPAYDAALVRALAFVDVG